MNDILYTVIMAIAFLIPGFIITSIIKKTIPTIDKEYNTRILENFIYSFLNIFLWAIPIYKIYLSYEWWKQNYLLLWGIGILIIFISPITISLIIILLNQHEVLRKVCQYFKVTNIDSEPSAWDFKFKNVENEWVIITMNNEKIVGGFIGENSFISSNPKEKDIYIDKVYIINENGEWVKRERTDGIWIKGEEIKSIEFLKIQERDESNE